MSDDSAVLITGLVVFCIVACRFLKFLQVMADFDMPQDKAKESAWDDEL